MNNQLLDLIDISKVWSRSLTRILFGVKQKRRLENNSFRIIRQLQNFYRIEGANLPRVRRCHCRAYHRDWYLEVETQRATHSIRYLSRCGEMPTRRVGSTRVRAWWSTSWRCTKRRRNLLRVLPPWPRNQFNVAACRQCKSHPWAMAIKRPGQTKSVYTIIISIDLHRS